VTDDRAALVRRIKEANDVVDVVGGYVALRPVGPTFKGLCPFHDDHRPSFDVDPRRQRYRCWSCGKTGDVINFIMEHDRVEFRDALELLARRAGISLEKAADSPHQRSRAVMLDVMRWSVEQYHQCLLRTPLAEEARRYLQERLLSAETISRFSLGFAPGGGEWLVSRATQAGLSFDTLEKVGLIARRQEGRGYYDRFRDRIMFPIRDRNGHPIGLGGRILPSNPLSARVAKYYNSSGTPLFNKSEQLYGLDLARQAGAAAGYLAVVEGYTDVLMAHQMGIPQVVATMGTALNARHVQQLLRWVKRVVLVFDADAGGNTGVDRALEIFVSQNVDLAIATLPEGLDPWDLLVQRGPEAFRQILEGAVDALDFKLSQVLATEANSGLAGRLRAMDVVLSIIVLAPEMQGHDGAVKRELVINRIAQRLAIPGKEEIVWARLHELRAAHRRTDELARRRGETTAAEKRQKPAQPRERQLLQILLAEPALVAVAARSLGVEQIAHPGLRRLLTELYALVQVGETPDLDALRVRVDNAALMDFALRAQEVGLTIPDRAAWLEKLLAEFHNCRVASVKEELQNQLQAANDHREAVELLRQLQIRTVSPGPASPPLGEAGLGRGGL
jgi:DNA primase